MKTRRQPIFQWINDLINDLNGSFEDPHTEIKDSDIVIDFHMNTYLKRLFTIFYREACRVGDRVDEILELCGDPSNLSDDQAREINFLKFRVEILGDIFWYELFSVYDVEIQYDAFSIRKGFKLVALEAEEAEDTDDEGKIYIVFISPSTETEIKCEYNDFGFGPTFMN